MELLEFFVPAEVTLRNWGVYIILAEDIENKTEYIYVGKVGDNRIGCNPVISRIGNHFSYNKIHSQFRNKAFENNFSLNNCNFRVFFKLFEEYNETEAIRIKHKNKTNERERNLNLKIQELKMEFNLGIHLLNIHKHKPSSKTRKERELLLSVEEKKELETFAKSVINKSTAYNRRLARLRIL